MQSAHNPLNLSFFAINTGRRAAGRSMSRSSTGASSRGGRRICSDRDRRRTGWRGQRRSAGRRELVRGQKMVGFGAHRRGHRPGDSRHQEGERRPHGGKSSTSRRSAPSRISSTPKQRGELFSLKKARDRNRRAPSLRGECEAGSHLRFPTTPTSPSSISSTLSSSRCAPPSPPPLGPLCVPPASPLPRLLLPPSPIPIPHFSFSRDGPRRRSGN